MIAVVLAALLGGEVLAAVQADGAMCRITIESPAKDRRKVGSRTMVVWYSEVFRVVTTRGLCRLEGVGLANWTPFSAATRSLNITASGRWSARVRYVLDRDEKIEVDLWVFVVDDAENVVARDVDRSRRRRSFTGRDQDVV